MDWLSQDLVALLRRHKAADPVETAQQAARLFRSGERVAAVDLIAEACAQ
jgi:hypothetical protein